jgi:hypothetical protein
VLARPHWHATILPLSAAALTLVTALAQGRSLGEALDAGLTMDPEFDFTALLQQCLAFAIFDDIVFADA